MKITQLVAVTLQVCASSVLAQGTFQNLNFEAANVSGYPIAASDVPVASALPGWSATYISATFGTFPQSQVWYDASSGGGQIIAINDINAPGGYGLSLIDGNYSAALFGGIGNVDANISQTGTVPAGTKSLRLDANYALLPFTVSLGGQNISMIPIGTGPNYKIYGADISAFSGLNATLSITEPGPATGPVPSGLYIDDIIFSPLPIPEPGAWSLLLCGAGLIGAMRGYRHLRPKP